MSAVNIICGPVPKTDPLICGPVLNPVYTNIEGYEETKQKITEIWKEFYVSDVWKDWVTSLTTLLQDSDFTPEALNLVISLKPVPLLPFMPFLFDGPGVFRPVSPLICKQ
jgi:hypothetical protein